jgi:hypothetical protein
MSRADNEPCCLRILGRSVNRWNWCFESNLTRSGFASRVVIRGAAPSAKDCFLALLARSHGQP